MQKAGFFIYFWFLLNQLKMKRLITTLLLSVAMMIVFNPAHARLKQESPTTDTIKVVKPVFSEADKTQADSLLSLGEAIADPTTKGLILDTVNTIKNVPTENTFDAWYGWIVAVIVALIGTFKYYKLKFPSKDEKPENTERYE